MPSGASKAIDQRLVAPSNVKIERVFVVDISHRERCRADQGDVDIARQEARAAAQRVATSASWCAAAAVLTTRAYWACDEWDARPPRSARPTDQPRARLPARCI